MSKKPSPKKKYGPRAVAVPHYLNSLTSDVDRSHDARDENRVFLLQVANRTVEKKDLAMYGRIMQITWVLAAKMERAQAGAAVFSGRVKFESEADKITGWEMVLR